MSLAAGMRLGPYEILGLIGAGGMGEVYRARDRKLQRDVAIKILPELFAADPDRLARFDREAQVLASLSHPNIATIYGFEQPDSGVHALALELVDGPTLAERIAQGPIPLDEALPIAHQIAEALEAAHEHGVIHRDLKPANIKLRSDGAVKVLDFGLAKAFEGEPAASGSGASLSPTITTPAATRMGVILGTAAYMSPEQARGKAVDRRSDMWAFGCVLYEMLTGRRAFRGEDVSETLAEVIKGEPDWSALPADTPAAIRRLLRRCLTKDPKGRVSDASIARIEIQEARQPLPPDTPGRSTRSRPPGWILAASAAALLIALLAGSAVWLTRSSESPPQPMRFTLELPPNVRLSPAATQRLVISRDGRRIAYSATESNVTRLYVRDIDRLEPTQVRGVERVGSLFLSPDGEWVGYNDTASGAFRKVPIAGGPSATICEVPAATGGFRGATWGTRGRIVFATGAAPGLMHVADGGGTPEPLTSPPEGEIHRDPHFLSDGTTVLFTVQRTGQPDQIALVSLQAPEPRILLAGAAPRFATSGHLVFQRENALWAAAFDAARLAVIGNPVPVLERVEIQPSSDRAIYDMAPVGSLVYSPAGSAEVTRALVWVDRQGKEEPIPAPPRAYNVPRLSPSASLIAVDVRDQENDIWIWDLQRQTFRRFTLHRSQDRVPVWTPDGRRLVFQSNRSGVFNLYWQAADQTGSVERLIESRIPQVPAAVAADGKSLLLTEYPAAKTLVDIMKLELGGSRQPDPVLRTEFAELNPEISPDGRWLAYEVRESGATHVYVRPYPDVEAGRWPISSDGGTQPLWSRDGREVFYLDSNGRLMSVAVDTASGFAAGTPKQILQRSYFFSGGANFPRTYDVSPDGRRFLMIKEAEASNQAVGPQVVVVLNWFEELKRLVPLN